MSEQAVKSKRRAPSKADAENAQIKSATRQEMTFKEIQAIEGLSSDAVQEAFNSGMAKVRAVFEAGPMGEWRPGVEKVSKRRYQAEARERRHRIVFMLERTDLMIEAIQSHMVGVRGFDTAPAGFRDCIQIAVQALTKAGEELLAHAKLMGGEVIAKEERK